MSTARPTPEDRSEFDALVALAQREHRARRLGEAATAYRRILAQWPDIAEAYNELGNVLIDQGKLDEAAAQYERATALKPSLFQAHNNLGNILWRQGKLDQAVARFEQTLALAPHLAEAHNNLGNVLKDQGKLDKAAAQYQQAVALRPDLAEAHNNLGAILRDQDMPEQALARFEQALALKPNLAEARLNLGNALKQQGKFEEALASYDRTLALRPDYVEAHYHRTDLKTFRAEDADLAALEALAADPRRLSPAKMVYVHFALGKALEDIGDYARAFQHWLQGNAFKRREVRYDEPANERDFQLIADVFDSSLIDRFAGVGDPSATPIFIVGMPRSGSTLIEQILASHPQVHAAGERPNLDHVVHTATEAGGRPLSFPASIRVLDADDFRRLGQAYLASLPTLADGKIRITDKTPGNFLFAGLIRLILPNARIIHTMRDAVDTCVSCFSTLFAQGQTFSFDLAELGRYHRRYQKLMEHWRSVLPAGAMLDVSYAEVVDNLEQQARRLIDCCGLPWDDRCLSFHQTNRPIRTASNVQVRRPLYRNSLARWRRYEAFLQPLLAELHPNPESKDVAKDKSSR